MPATVILVDEANAAIGMADAIDAHTGKGKLHRAFSVYVFSPDRSSLLIQKRSEKKMLFAGMWANTCCSHPFEYETSIDAGERRLKEEMGFTVPLTEGPSFIYRAEDPNGKGVEHEHVTTLIGTADPSMMIEPNPDEVAAVRWIDVNALRNGFEAHPDLYAPWLHIGLIEILKK